MPPRETIVRCEDCGAAQTAYVADDGSVSVNGRSGCRRCSGRAFTDVAVHGDEGG